MKPLTPRPDIVVTLSLCDSSLNNEHHNPLLYVDVIRMDLCVVPGIDPLPPQPIIVASEA